MKPITVRLSFLFFGIISCFSILVATAAAHADSSMDALLDLSLEELLNVVVTSQKREEKLQEIGLAVTALSTDDLEQWNIFDITRLGPLVPGLVVGRSGYDPRPAMRGARTQQVEENDAVVSVYHNGVYRPRHAQSMTPYIDISRIEIMRGPQGTLFGRNSFGGTINVIANAPEMHTRDYFVKGTLGDYEEHSVTGFINMPVGKSSAIRMTGFAERRDPFVENRFDSDAGLRDKNTRLLRGQFYTELTNKSDLLIKAEYWSETSNGNGLFGYKLLGVPLDTETGLTNPSAPLVPRIGRDDVCGANCGRIGAGLDQDAATVLSDPYQIASDFGPSQNIDEVTFVSELNHKLDFANLKVLAAHMDFEDLRFGDTDFSTYPSVIEGYDLTSKSNTLEIQMASNNANDLQWVAGIFYLREEMRYAYLWRDLIDLADNKPAPSATPKNEWASWMRQLQLTTTSTALYGQMRYAHSDQFHTVVGIRNTHDERQWDINRQNQADLTNINFSESLYKNVENSWDSNTWKLAAEFNWNKNSIVYGSVSTGFLAGNYSVNDESFDEETVVAYEVGNKNILLDNRLHVSLALYYNAYSDMAATSFEEVDGGTFQVTTNAGEIDAVGLEMELDWLISHDFQIGLRGEISKTEYGDFVVPNRFQSGGETINGVGNLFQLKGEQVMYSPDYSFTFYSQYELPVNIPGRVNLGLLWHLSDDYRVSEEPFAFAVQDGYSTVDINVNWESRNRKWDLGFFVSNITNEAVLVRGNRFGGNVAAADYADPRMFALRLTYSD